MQELAAVVAERLVEPRKNLAPPSSRRDRRVGAYQDRRPAPARRAPRAGCLHARRSIVCARLTRVLGSILAGYSTSPAVLRPELQRDGLLAPSTQPPSRAPRST